MVFGASPAFAHEHGGPLTRAFLEALDLVGMAGIIVDTRSHMLFPGHFPAIGGWHCDLVARGEDGQPDLGRLRDGGAHWTYTSASVDGLCHVEFAAEPTDLEIERTAGSLWSDVHRAMAARTVATTKIPHGRVVEFYRDSLHRPTKADRIGWRFFARASEATTEPQNKIRRQVQVYIENEAAGW